MPRLSDSMEEGTILKWLKGDGETVSEGEELLEVETDKATVTVTAEAEGVLRILVEEGATVAVGTVIGSAGRGSAEPRNDAPAPAPAPAAVADPASSRGGDRPVPARARDGAHNGAGPAATPLARRMARVHGVELASLTGSGPRGRITRDDVLAAAGVETPRAAPALESITAPPREPAPAPPPPTAPPPEPGDGEAVPLTRIQLLIARRMSEARSAIPEFEVQTEVVMDEALALRAQLRELPGEHAAASVNDLI